MTNVSKDGHSAQVKSNVEGEDTQQKLNIDKRELRDRNKEMSEEPFAKAQML